MICVLWLSFLSSNEDACHHKVCITFSFTSHKCTEIKKKWNKVNNKKNTISRQKINKRENKASGNVIKINHKNWKFYQFMLNRCKIGNIKQCTYSEWYEQGQTSSNSITAKISILDNILVKLNKILISLTNVHIYRHTHVQ